jgi:hypothetical protein
VEGTTLATIYGNMSIVLKIIGDGVCGGENAPKDGMREGHSHYIPINLSLHIK